MSWTTLMLFAEKTRSWRRQVTRPENSIKRLLGRTFASASPLHGRGHCQAGEFHRGRRVSQRRVIATVGVIARGILSLKSWAIAGRECLSRAVGATPHKDVDMRAYPHKSDATLDDEMTEALSPGVNWLDPAYGAGDGSDAPEDAPEDGSDAPEEAPDSSSSSSSSSSDSD